MAWPLWMLTNNDWACAAVASIKAAAMASDFFMKRSCNEIQKYATCTGGAFILFTLPPSRLR
jgi:hypothetical protein